MSRCLDSSFRRLILLCRYVPFTTNEMDKFHFVLKGPNSSSLSHGDEEEQYNIRRHAQTRRRAASRSPAPKAVPRSRDYAQRTSINGALRLRSKSTISLINSDHGTSETMPGAAVVRSVSNHRFKHVASAEDKRDPLSFISNNAFDPFPLPACLKLQPHIKYSNLHALISARTTFAQKR